MTNKDTENKEENKDQELMQKVSEQIKAILEENKLALQPTLNMSPYGILPMVNLVKIPEDTESTQEPQPKDDK